VRPVLRNYRTAGSGRSTPRPAPRPGSAVARRSRRRANPPRPPSTPGLGKPCGPQGASGTTRPLSSDRPRPKSRAMSPGFSRLLVHVLFSTKRQEPYLADEKLRAAVHRALADACKPLRANALAVGGTADHVHVFAQL